MLARLILSDEGAQRSPVIQPEFPIPIQLGCVVGTEAAMALLAASGADLNELLCSHRAWSWRVGDVLPIHQNNDAVPGGLDEPRLLSAFSVGPSNRRLWVLTDVKRNLTLLLLPKEYQRQKLSHGP